MDVMSMIKQSSRCRANREGSGVRALFLSLPSDRPVPMQRTGSVRTVLRGLAPVELYVLGDHLSDREFVRALALALTTLNALRGVLRVALRVVAHRCVGEGHVRRPQVPQHGEGHQRLDRHALSARHAVHAAPTEPRPELRADRLDLLFLSGC